MLHPLQHPIPSFSLILRMCLNVSPSFCPDSLEKGAAGGRAPHPTSLSCFGHGLIHVLDPYFFPHLLLTLFWAHPALVVAHESFPEALPTNTSSSHVDIQELVLIHLLHQPKNSSSGSQCAPSTTHLMEHTEFSPLLSPCSFLFFLRQGQLSWNLLCRVLGM